MAKKRSTKADREAAEKAALKQRLFDMARGACGSFNVTWEGEESGGLAAEMGLDAFGRWLGAISTHLLDDSRNYLVKPHNFQHFDSLDEAVEHLYGAGVRAE